MLDELIFSIQNVVFSHVIPELYTQIHVISNKLNPV